MLLDNQKMAANIQFERWTADQVAEWLRGKDICANELLFNTFLPGQDPSSEFSYNFILSCG